MARPPKDPARPKVTKASIDYEALDTPPRYVEGVQGLITPKGAVQIHFFSDYVAPPSSLTPETRVRGEGDDFVVDMRIEDPYGLADGQFRFTRRIEANLILSEKALRELHNWVGQMLQQMDSRVQPVQALPE